MLLFIGIDWGEQRHAICVLNDAGAILARQTLPHTPNGFGQFETLRQQLGVAPPDCIVGLETAHSVLIDYLWAQGYSQIYVVPPNVVKSSRGRYRQSGARSDDSDAYVVADVLRTDRARLQPWHPDRLLTRQLRARSSLLLHLTHSAVRLSNRLRAVLLRYYPAALHVFSDLDTQILLHFVQAYPTPAAARHLSFAAFQRFAQQHAYPQPAKLRACYARLQQPYPVAQAETVQVYQAEAVQLARLLLDVVRTKRDVVRETQQIFRQHPDAPIFASLPGAGEILQPGLLAKFGDDRGRFPTPASVQSLAGTCPVTEQSGKKRVIKFRRACDREFRSLAHSWAVASVPQSVWAQAYWSQVRPRCATDSHAYRCLANRWLAIAWTLWQRREPYDEAYHLQQRAARSRPLR